MKKVIIAEDHKEVRKRLVEMIFSQGIEIDEVDNGSKLVEKVKFGEYNLILTDNKMPIMDGLNAIIKIREFNKEVPIYLLSFESDKGRVKILEERALEYGANGFLNKLDTNLSDKIEEIKKTYLKG